MSARIDGERPLLPDRQTDRHLDRCPACRDFRQQVTGLARQVAVRSARPVPPALRHSTGQALAGLGVSGSDPSPVGAGTRATGWWAAAAAGTQGRWRRAVRWAAAGAPVAALSVALPLGAWSQPRLLHPTRPATPCTAALVHPGRHGGD